MQLVKGADLSPMQKRQVLSAFVYRHLAIGEGKHYASEEAWVNDHAFYFTKRGDLANRPKFAEPAFMADRE